MTAQEMIKQYEIGDTVLYNGEVYTVYGYRINKTGCYLETSDIGNLLNVENLKRTPVFDMAEVIS